MSCDSPNIFKRALFSCVSKFVNFCNVCLLLQDVVSYLGPHVRVFQTLSSSTSERASSHRSELQGSELERLTQRNPNDSLRSMQFLTVPLHTAAVSSNCSPEVHLSTVWLQHYLLDIHMMFRFSTMATKHFNTVFFSVNSFGEANLA